MDDMKTTVYGLSSTVCIAGVVVRAVVEPSRDIESLRGRMGESTRGVEGLFDALLAQTMDGGR